MLLELSSAMWPFCSKIMLVPVLTPRGICIDSVLVYSIIPTPWQCLQGFLIIVPRLLHEVQGKSNGLLAVRYLEICIKFYIRIYF